MRDLPSFEDDIYQAAFFPENWPKVLDRISRAIGADGALLANVSDASLPWIASEGVAELFADFFREGWAYDNARTHALVTIPHRGFMSDADRLSEEWMAAQAIYRDFLWPRGFGYAAATIVDTPGPASSIAVSIEKRRALGPVSMEDIAFLDTLRPHLSRAAVLASRLEFARIEAAMQALRIAKIPAATIQSDGRVVATNELFETYAHAMPIGARDMIRFAHPAADGFYRTLRAPGGRQRGKSVPLPATENTPAAILHFVPISGLAREVFLRASYFLLVTPVDRSQIPSADLVSGLFDLTATESRIAERLIRGEVISEIANGETSSVETVRTHVKSILGKAGMGSQRDFVAAMSSIRPIGI